jgi:tripartite-type tricarboxylate transporter receptor subunit TctC
MTPLLLKALLFGVAMLATVCLIDAPGGKRIFPDRPITIVVPFAPAGPADVIAGSWASTWP